MAIPSPCTSTITLNGDFPGGPMVKTVLPLQGAWVRSQVGKLRSCMPHSMANTHTHTRTLSECKQIEFTKQKREYLDGVKHKTQLYADSRRLISVLSKGLQNNTLSNLQPKESRCNHTHIRQNRPQAKKVNRRQRRALYTNNKGCNSFRKHIY